MKFLTLIYLQPELLAALSQDEYDSHMRGCLLHADELKAAGQLLDSQQLEDVQAARTLRVRKGQSQITDGPFAETREVLGGFNLIEAPDLDAAMQIAAEFPWARFGSIEVRPVRDLDTVRQQVGA